MPSIFDGLRPSRKNPAKPIDAVADHKLDAALERLADATRVNTEMVQRVRVRQSSGQIKIVTTPTPAE
jgi:hypothetical protein